MYFCIIWLLGQIAASTRKQLMASKNAAFVSCRIVMLTRFMWKQHKSPMAISALAAFLNLFQPLMDVITVAPVVGSVASMLSCFSLGLAFESMHILHCSLMLLAPHFYLHIFLEHTVLCSLAPVFLQSLYSEIRGTTNNLPCIKFIRCC